MEKTLEILLKENEGRPLKALNVLIESFAKEHGLDLEVETNYHYCEREEDVIQAISVEKELEETLQLLGATMTPSVSELEKRVRDYQGEEPFEDMVTITTSQNTYTVPVFMDILNKTLSLWVDMNELQDTTPVAI